jgi:DNA polymerase-3 subunit epsilon
MPEQLSHSRKVSSSSRNLWQTAQSQWRCNGTVKLFKMLLDKDLEKEIIKDFIKFKIEVSSKLIDILNGLPAVTGVYYIYKKWYSYLYWEKYKHQKKANQHFTGITNSAKRFKLKYLPYLTKKQEVNWWLF